MLTFGPPQPVRRRQNNPPGGRRGLRKPRIYPQSDTPTRSPTARRARSVPSAAAWASPARAARSKPAAATPASSGRRCDIAETDSASPLRTAETCIGSDGSPGPALSRALSSARPGPLFSRLSACGPAYGRTSPEGGLRHYLAAPSSNNPIKIELDGGDRSRKAEAPAKRGKPCYAVPISGPLRPRDYPRVGWTRHPLVLGP